MQIAYPYQIAHGATAAASQEQHVRDMIEALLFTRPGERVNRPDFGSGLLQMVFAPNSPELAATLQFSLQAALLQWLGDVIVLQGLEVSAQDSLLRIRISYALRGGQPQTAVFEREVA